MEGQIQEQLMDDDVFVVVRDYRREVRTRRWKMIREGRKQDMWGNGRKSAKRIRKYQPIYKYNSYETDQPWDILVEHPPSARQEWSECEVESIGVSVDLLREGSTSAQKESQTTIVSEPRGQPLLFAQQFTKFQYTCQ